MKHSLHLYVRRVASGAGDDGMGQGILQAGATGMTGAVFLDVTDTVQRVFDGVIAGAAAKIALEPEGKVFFLLIGKAGGGHDHPRRTEAALKSLCVEKCLLHWMQLSVFA